MRWRRIAFWLGLGTLALIVLALTWLWTADLGVFKPQVEQFVTEKTGREFAIDGNFHVDLAGSTSVIAENVRFQNAEWADAADMVTVGRVEVRVDLWSLFSGPIIFELIDVDNAEILLLQPENEEPNWVLPVEEEPEPETQEPGVDLLFEQIFVDNVRLFFQSPERDHPLDLHLKVFRQQLRADGLLDLVLNAMLDGRVVKLEGEVGTWDSLLAGKDVQFDIDAVLDTFEFAGSGRIDDLANPLHPEIQFTATGPDIDDLTQLLGLGDEGSGDINLSGSLQKTADEQLLLETNGNIGETSIQARGTVSDLQDPQNVALDLVASGPDLGRVLRLAGIHEVREAPFMLRIDAETQGDAFIINEGNMVFADAQIDVEGRMPNFPSVDDAVIKLLIEGPDIAHFRYVTGLPGAAEGAFSLGFTIDVTDEGVEILQLDIETSLGEIRGNGSLGPPPEFYGSEFKFRVRSDSLERLAGAYGLADLPDYPFEVKGSAEYVQGNIRTLGPLVVTVERLRAAVEGQVALTSGIEGSDLAFEIEGPDLAKLIGAFAAAEGVPPDPYDFRGQLQVRDDGYHFRDVRGSLGTSAIRVDGLLTTTPGFGGTRFSFAAEGPAFEDLAEDLGDLEIQEGPYELSGNVELQPDRIDFKDLELDRDAGHVSLDLGLGLPISDRRVEYDMRVRGSDVRSIVPGIGPLMFKEQPVSIDARGKLDGSYLKFEKFDAVIGDAKISTKGELDFTEGGRTSKLHWSGNIPSLARFATLDGAQLHDQGVGWSANLVGGDGELRVDDMVATLGDSDVNGKMFFKEGDVPELDIDVYSDSIVFAPLREKPEYEYEPEPEFEDGKFIPDVAIPFEAMRNLNASIEIDIKELQRATLLMRDIEFNAYLRDGTLEISKAAFKARSGAVLARARLEPVDDSGAASFELVARQFALGMAQTNLDMAMTGDIDINIRSTGADLRTLLGNANGEFFVNARGGRVTNNRFLQALYGDLLQEIVGTVNPFRESDPYTDFECIVVPWQLDDGQLNSAPSTFIGTSKVRMAATSSINLKTEELRVTIRTTPQRALSISAGELVNPYVQVIGTLGAPRLAVDEKGLLISGGAAVATAGLSLLARGVWDRMSRSKDPCKQVSDRAIEALGDRFPDLAIEGPERIE